MAELSTTGTIADRCCTPEQQVTCCEPSAKANCCGHKESCSCDAAPTFAKAVRAVDPVLSAHSSEPR